MNRKTLVFGASLNSGRYSNIAVRRLVDNGIDVVAFGSEGGTIYGIEIETELQRYSDIDTVSLYMNPFNQSLFYDYIIGLNPNRVVFNPGTENPEFWKRLDDHGINYEVACTLVLLSTNQY